jgi:hypothetical protein
MVPNFCKLIWTHDKCCFKDRHPHITNKNSTLTQMIAHSFMTYCILHTMPQNMFFNFKDSKFVAIKTQIVQFCTFGMSYIFSRSHCDSAIILNGFSLFMHRIMQNDNVYSKYNYNKLHWIKKWSVRLFSVISYFSYLYNSHSVRVIDKVPDLHRISVALFALNICEPMLQNYIQSSEVKTCMPYNECIQFSCHRLSIAYNRNLKAGSLSDLKFLGIHIKI